MDTKTLKDVLKDAPEVTSLSSTDKVLVTDVNGGTKKIDKTNLVQPSKIIYISTPQWVRLFSFNYTDILFRLSQSYSNNPGGVLLVNASLLSDNTAYCFLDVISKYRHSSVTTNPFTKMRVCVKKPLGYVDFYYPHNAKNALTLNVISAQNDVVTLMEQNATVPADFTSREYEINWGGG